jgi:M6 family metalloprotease-like protein
MKKMLLLILVVGIVSPLLFAMPSVPGKADNLNYKVYPSERYGRRNSSFREDLPQNILVLMVEFSDVTFDLVPDYPDSLAHNKEYFERLFFHLASFYADASHGNYVLTEDNYTVWDNIITLTQPMGYYGENDEEDHQQIELICEFLQDVVAQTDDAIDFNNYDAITIIHAGAGEEADTNETNDGELSSTFLSRRSLQAGLDPENDDFPGIETNDGVFLTEFVIIPETEWQPDSVQGEDTIYSIFGVIAHQFGHQIGLPTLFDNDKSNGKSYGIGGFGVMGTGVWNANGFVPPLPCAWSRYYLGWEDDNIVELNSTFENLSLVFPMAEDEETPKLYKIIISEDEYFLIENRQQNPDESFFINSDGDTLSTYTFQTIPNQKVYPEGHPYAGQPKFSFMDNSYAGCEWDFYLPGYGFGAAPENDGSGILIWHIDENVINENFTPDFEIHSVNGDASHKGVDLEEADGIQQLDSTLYGYSSFYGSKDDSYREGNNTYFGGYDHNGIFSTPIANSYYGGIPLKIHNISNSDSIMAFSVEYEWSLDTGDLGENPFPAALIDFDGDGENEMFYSMPNGMLYLWKNDLLYSDFPINVSIPTQVCNYFAFDEQTKSILVPTKTENNGTAYLFQIDNDLEDYQELLFLQLDRSWAAPPVVNPDANSEYRVFVPLHDNNSNDSEIIFLNSDYEVIETLPTEYIASNLMYKDDELFFVDDNWKIQKITLTDYEQSEFELDIEAPYPNILSALLVDIDLDNSDDFIITAEDSILYVFNSEGNNLTGFPQNIPLNSFAIPSISDIDNNGFLEILIGGENTFAVFDKNGEVFKPSCELTDPDSLFIASGIIALNIDDDDEKEIIGTMSRNRLCVWDNVNFNNFELNRNYNISFGNRSLNYPLISDYSSSGIDAFIASNNGTIYKTGITTTQEDIDTEIWQVEYANLQRTASLLTPSAEPPGNENKIFNKAQTYFYPNPLSTTFNKAINYHSQIPAETIILRIETYLDVDVKIKIFDIAANKIYENISSCETGFDNKIYIDASDLSSGVYFAVLSAKGKILKLKFAIEK